MKCIDAPQLGHTAKAILGIAKICLSPASFAVGFATGIFR
jgi:hypothetical protein